MSQSESPVPSRRGRKPSSQSDSGKTGSGQAAADPIPPAPLFEDDSDDGNLVIDL